MYKLQCNRNARAWLTNSDARLNLIFNKTRNQDKRHSRGKKKDWRKKPPIYLSVHSDAAVIFDNNNKKSNLYALLTYSQLLFFLLSITFDGNWWSFCNHNWTILNRFQWKKIEVDFCVQHTRVCVHNMHTPLLLRATKKNKFSGLSLVLLFRRVGCCCLTFKKIYFFCSIQWNSIFCCCWAFRF